MRSLSIVIFITQKPRKFNRLSPSKYKNLCYNMAVMKLLNKLVTNKSLLRLSHGLSEGLNRLSELSGSAARRRERNRAAFDGYAGGDYINGQGRGPVALLPFGRRTMDYNGCEVIACFNALRLLGNPRPLGEVAAYFERRGLFLGGLWGTHAEALPRYFASLGFQPETLYASAVMAPSDYDAAFAPARAGVFSFWNDAGCLLRGVHTVALAHRPGGITIYNLYNQDARENTRFPSIEAFIRARNALPVLLVTLK